MSPRYQLQELRSGWRVVKPCQRGGKVTYMALSPVYRQQAEAEACLQRRLKSLQEFQAFCSAVLAGGANA